MADAELTAGDGAGISELTSFEIKARDDAEVLIFDLP